mgnify:FL=1
MSSGFPPQPTGPSGHPPQPYQPSLTPPPRQTTFASPLSQGWQAAPAVIPQARVVQQQMPVGGKRRGAAAIVWIVGVLVVLFVALVAYFLQFLGPGASIIGMILALVPLAGVLVAVYLIDRWEPEPPGLVVLALAWGAVGAIGLTLLVDFLLSIAIDPRSPLRGDAFTSVVQAPLVEEFFKGLGVFLIYVFARRAFDGPVDGIVYGALVGAGFAFTENIQYFAVSLIEGGFEETTATFFVRGILSPFAHVMFTSVTGFALGLAARRGYGPSAALGPGLIGLAGAVALHALWNGSAVFGDFIPLYVTVQVPFFIAFILGVLALRREEARLTRARLGDYAAAGWFTPQEVNMLATGPGRRAGLAWARTLPGDRTRIMKSFILDATRLAAARQRAISGRDPLAFEMERELLARTAQARATLFAP